MLVTLTKGNNNEHSLCLAESQLNTLPRVTDTMLLEYFAPMGSVANIKIVAVSTSSSPNKDAYF